MAADLSHFLSVDEIKHKYENYERYMLIYGDDSLKTVA